MLVHIVQEISCKHGNKVWWSWCTMSITQLHAYSNHTYLRHAVLFWKIQLTPVVKINIGFANAIQKGVGIHTEMDFKNNTLCNQTHSWLQDDTVQLWCTPYCKCWFDISHPTCSVNLSIHVLFQYADMSEQLGDFHCMANVNDFCTIGNK